MAIVLAAALLLPACSPSTELSPEEPLAEIETAARARSACTVTPNPAGVGVDYVVRATGLPASVDLRVEITDAAGTAVVTARSDAAGSLSVTARSAASGAGRAVVRDPASKRPRTLASCSFEVLDTSCTPSTCAELGAECGPLSDGCGGTLDCGSCVAPDTCGGGGTANACGNSGSTWPSDWAALEEQVLALINARRAAGATCGATVHAPAAPLASHAAIREAARLHSFDMATNDYFDHVGRDGRLFTERMVDAGWSGSCACGENIAAGYATADAVVSAWMNSPGHCANIMNAAYGAIGVGYAFDAGATYDRYFTLDFAAR